MRVLSQLSKTTTPRLTKRWASGLAGVEVGNHNSTLKQYQESHHSSCKMTMTMMCPPPPPPPPPPASRLFSSSHVKGGKNNNLPIIRCFNSLSRAFPSYSILGEKCLFAMKPILPKFKHIQQGPSNSSSSSSNAISLMQKGRMLLEFTPTNEGNQMGFKWKDKISFALNVEEMGLLLSQLPHYSVTFSRRIGGEANAAAGGGGSGFGASTYDLVSMGSTSTTNDYMDKVLTVQPGDGATVTFHIDYVKDGVGGQKAPAAFVSNEVSSSAPLQVVLQAGEWEVVATLLRDSIPHLLGWNQLMNVAVHNVMNDGGGGGGGDYGP